MMIWTGFLDERNKKPIQNLLEQVTWKRAWGPALKISTSHYSYFYLSSLPLFSYFKQVIISILEKK
jgi:hypothetical protein